MFRNRDALAKTQPQEVALDCLAAGIRGADPEQATRKALSRDGDRLTVAPKKTETTLDLDQFDRVVVLGGGKAVAGVVRALDDHLGAAIDAGQVVVPEGSPAASSSIGAVDVEPGGHPFPTEAGAAATERVLGLAETADEGTLVLAAISGGGSALLAAPSGNLTVESLRGVTQTLLEAGADIREINAVRKHCSAVKGGRLAAACAPATVVGIAVSDVVGDPLSVIASGPTAPDETTYRDAFTVLDRYDVDAPRVRAHLERGLTGGHPETPGPDAALFERVRNHVVASNRTALDAAAAVAAEHGFEPCILSSRVRGEAAAAASTHVAIAAEAAATGDPVEPPAVLLSGGETTVALGGTPPSGDSGDTAAGGPNLEFALAATVELNEEHTGEQPSAVVAAVDTDGHDGSSEAAGGLVDAESVDDAAGARDALARHDSLSYLARRRAALRTGATGTNVNDLRLVVVPDD